MVRSIISLQFKTPWPFFKKGSKGWRKIGPNYYEEHKWAGQNKEFPELTSKFQKENLPELHDYTNVQSIGYIDFNSKKFVKVPEMIPKLVVPDLTDFKLKPYVSFRTDVEIESRRSKYEKVLTKKGSSKAADLATIDSERWPPPKMDSKTLFDLFYAEKIKKTFILLNKKKQF